MSDDLQPSSLLSGSHPLSHMREEIQHYFNRLSHLLSSPFQNNSNEDAIRPLIPALDFYESDKELVIQVEVPGLSEDDIKIEVNRGTLTLSAQKKMKREKEGRTYHMVERASGIFVRTLHLPLEVDPDEIEATVKNGILKITLPKNEKNKTHRHQIKVKKG
ncbi:MAG: Hsp20/alpha crystallin family protein [Holosporales bacterium]